MIYGANGYTGQLIAELAASRGEKPILAGRNAGKVRGIADKLGLPWRAFALDRPDLRDVRLVLHCAGPFSATSRPMVDACLAARSHYLNITGEVEVFESVFARDAEARERGTRGSPDACRVSRGVRASVRDAARLSARPGSRRSSARARRTRAP